MSIEGRTAAERKGLPEACSTLGEDGKVDPLKEDAYNKGVREAVQSPADVEEYTLDSRGMSSMKFATCLGCLGTFAEGFDLPPACHALQAGYPAPPIPEPRPGLDH